MSDIKVSYDILSNVYKHKAFSSIELTDKLEYATNKKVVTRIVYGVLEKDVELEYYISLLTKKRPQSSIVIVLKMGMYCIKYMDSMPIYAVVNNLVDLTEYIGKKQLKGFINSTLKHFSTTKLELPLQKTEALSIEASVPFWLVAKYVKQYGYDVTREFLLSKPERREHIRPNTRLCDLDKLKQLCDSSELEYEESGCGGLWISNDKKLRGLFDRGLITIQSKTSMLCVQAMEVKNGDKILDMCAAPGGKGIYAQELADNVEVISCDIHEHRVKLIDSYMQRMQVEKMTAMLADATEFNPAFENVFDIVLCDVPCSGFGVAKKKPDIYIDSSFQKVEELSELQYKILCNASKYASEKGKIVYSTCTLLREENYNIVGKFVKENPEWKVEYFHQYLPDDKGTDGFFVARLVRA